jgi:hypothetical protein
VDSPTLAPKSIVLATASSKDGGRGIFSSLKLYQEGLVAEGELGMEDRVVVTMGRTVVGLGESFRLTAPYSH